MESNRFTQKSMEALQSCQQIAQSYGNAQVEQIHLLCALISQSNGLIGQMMSKLGLHLQDVQSACMTAVSKLPKISGSNQQPHVSGGLAAILTHAEAEMQQMRDEYVSVEHLFLALLEKADSTVKPIFSTFRLSKAAFLKALQEVRGSARVTSEDPEATYLVARLLLDGVLKTPVKNQEEHALMLMCLAANNGCIQARAYLNAYCEGRYQKEQGVSSAHVTSEGLVDFEGKPIKINRQGIFTPIDAVLECKDGKNTLILSTNVMFLYDEEINEKEKFEQAVLKGLLAWQGEYEVFGGQKLSVKVRVTNDDNVFDNLLIIPITREISSAIINVGNVISSNEKKAQITDMMSKKRSFATSGFKWSVNSRKIIYLQSEDGMFDDYDEIEHVAKHEFGHALGLGDLYASSVDSLGGVSRGTFIELDSYAISDQYYNLVMCDHHGPISNNDIEISDYRCVNQ